MTTKATIEQIIAALQGRPLTLELQLRSWLVAQISAWDEMPEELLSRIAEGITAAELEAVNIRVLCNGMTGDEDTSLRDRYAVNCSVVVLCDWKSIPLESFKALSSIVSRAVRSLNLEVSFQDTTGADGGSPFYWNVNEGGSETDVLSLDSDFWDGPTGRAYNHASFNFSLFFSRSETAKYPVYNQGESL